LLLPSAAAFAVELALFGEDSTRHSVWHISRFCCCMRGLHTAAVLLLLLLLLKRCHACLTGICVCC
jgi:hypothetical protein